MIGIKDVIFDGKILDMVCQSTEWAEGQLHEHAFLGQNKRFAVLLELPEFCWTESSVNAIGYCEYSSNIALLKFM